MTEAKHTPGPWEALVEKKSKYFPKGSAMVRTGEGRLAIDCNDSGDTKESSAANAYLIAAAPDLLAALEAALPFIDDAGDVAQFYPDSSATDACRAAVQMARAAIARTSLPA